MRASALGFALLLVAALSTPGLADEQSEALLQSFVHSIDALRDWSASAATIRSEGADTVAANVTFARENPHVSVKLGELRLTDLAGGADGGFTAAAITLAEGQIATEGLDYTVPAATLKDVSAPSVTGVVVDPHHLMTFIAQVYAAAARMEFSSLSIPEMQSVQTQPGMGGDPPITVRVDYRNLASSGLKGGVLASSEIGPISFQTTGPDGEAKFELRSAVAERLDLGALAHVLDPAQYRNRRGDQVWRPLLSKLTYSGLSGAGPKGAGARLDEIAVETVDTRQPERAFTAVWDRILDPSIANSAKSDLALEAVQDMYAAWRVGTLRINGLSAESPDDGASLALASLSVTGLSNQGIDSFILKKLRGKGPGGFAALDSFEFAGLIFPDLQALMRFAALQNEASPEEHANIIRATFSALPRLAHIGLSELAAGVTETAAVTLAGFTLDFRDWNEFYAQGTDLRLDDLEIPHVLMALSPEAARMMDELGYDRLTIGAAFTDHWAPGPGTDDATLTVTAKDAADLQLSYSLTGLTTDWILRSISAAGKTGGSEAAAMAVMGDIGLKKATLKVTDRSLLDRGFGFAAKKQGLSVSGAAYREQMRGALPFLLSAAVPAEISKLLSAPLQAFLAGGQSFVAEIAPAAPVPLPEIAAAAQSDPKLLKDRLNVTVRSEPAAP
jgi:hypothetical protein